MDARVNSGEALLSDRSLRQQSDRRVNRHQQIGESHSVDVKDLLRMASTSASRDLKITTPR